MFNVGVNSNSSIAWFGLIVLVLALAGCNSKAPFNDFAGDEVALPQTSNLLSGRILNLPYVPYYLVDGHYSTAGYIAHLAGVDRAAVREISCYTQTPDQEALRYSAPYVAFWGVFDWSYRHEIVDSLHSLHGGNTSEVVIRRKRLRKLIVHSIAAGRPEWETGFLIHAFGDSYAHVHMESDGEHAYHAFVGHAFANVPWGERPYSIFVNGHYKNYIAYVNELYGAITEGARSESGDRESLNKFTAKIESEAAKGQDAKKRVSFFMSQPDFSNDAGDKVSICNGYNAALDKTAVRIFLKALARKLDA